MERRCYKAINFDLFTKELQKLYPGANYRHAYYDIQFFFLKNHFIHRQGSGYISSRKLSSRDIYKFINALSEKYIWLGDSVNKMDVTNIGKQYDLTGIFRTEPLSNREQEWIK